VIAISGIEPSVGRSSCEAPSRLEHKSSLASTGCRRATATPTRRTSASVAGSEPATDPRAAGGCRRTIGVTARGLRSDSLRGLPFDAPAGERWCRWYERAQPAPAPRRCSSTQASTSMGRPGTASRASRTRSGPRRRAVDVAHGHAEVLGDLVDADQRLTPAWCEGSTRGRDRRRPSVRSIWRCSTNDQSQRRTQTSRSYAGSSPPATTGPHAESRALRCHAPRRNRQIHRTHLWRFPYGEPPAPSRDVATATRRALGPTTTQVRSAHRVPLTCQ